MSQCFAVLMLALAAVACSLPETPAPPAINTLNPTFTSPSIAKLGLADTPSPTSPPAATNTPSATDTPPPSKEPATSQEVSAVVAAQALNVRTGPGVAYPSLGAVAGGTEITLDGRNGPGTWVRSQIPGEELAGWLSTAYLEIEGDVTSLSVVEVGPPPQAPEPPTGSAPAASGHVVEAVPPGLSWVVADKRVTAMYRDASGTLYFAGPKDTQGIGDPFHAEAAVWRMPVNGEPIQLTPFIYNAIGGIVVHNSLIYFNEAGSLRRMPDDNQMHEAEVVLHFPNLSKIYMHINHALAKYTINGEDVLLMAVGSRLDSNYDAPQHHSGIRPPYYEDFPTGRILYAKLSWLETVGDYEVQVDIPGQVSEFARGLRNPWSIAVGFTGGRTRILAVDNDPTLTPEKADGDPQNAGEEVTEVFQNRHHGHPYFYAGREPEPDYVRPITVFPDGSVPSGVAIAAGKLFVALHGAGMITKVDLANHSWTPVMTDIQPFNLYGYGNLLYILDWAGIRVIDARKL